LPAAVPLHSVVYISTMRTGLGKTDVEAILASAQRNNGSRQLTGVLLQYAGHFVQALEGPGEALDEIFGRIGADPRHDDLTVLERAPLPARRFPDWSMRSLAVAPGDEPAVDAFFRALVDEQRAVDLAYLVQLLQALARRH
jgi:hypothetical protein